MTLDEIFVRIAMERRRQEKLKLSGKFEKTCADDMTDHEKLTVLMEEVGEVARAILDGKREDMKRELVEVAAVATAWLESL